MHRPMSARPGVGRLGLHQRRRLPSALRGGLDYHPRSVVNWLTRCNVENSSCKPVTCSVGGGLFCCPPGHQRGPDGPLGGLWKLKKLCAHVLFSFRLLATAPAVVRLACCGCIVARLNASCQAFNRAFSVLHKSARLKFVQIARLNVLARCGIFIKNKTGVIICQSRKQRNEITQIIRRSAIISTCARLNQRAQQSAPLPPPAGKVCRAIYCKLSAPGWSKRASR